MNFKGKNIAVIGYGVEGRSSAEYLKKRGAQVTVLDKDESTNVDNQFNSKLGQNYLNDIDTYDLVLKSPTVQLNDLKNAKSITTATQIFFDNCSVPIIGVTGTKGKGTTSTLIVELLESQGVKTHLGGNIGTPMLSFIDDISDGDAVVLELSSFQLIDLKSSPEIAVCLMIEPDHMNWHQDMNEYIEAKATITKYQKEDDIFIYHPTNKNDQKIADNSPAKTIKYMHEESVFIEAENIIFRQEPLLKTYEVGLIGSHNLENICAALTVLDHYTKRRNITLDEQIVAQTIREFKGLEHRLEFVRELDGVKYFNDSFASAADAAMAGVSAFDRKVIAIIGGVDKGGVAEKLAEAAMKTKYAIVIGEIAPKVAEILTEQNFKDFEIVNGPMANIIKTARSKTSEGDIVLLSPGTSSYDMFKNFKDRGEQFKRAVKNL